MSRSPSAPNISFEESYWRKETFGSFNDAHHPSGDEFRSLAENLPTPCWIARADGYIIWYNQVWHDYCGTTSEDMEGWGWQSVQDPDVHDCVLERWRHSIESGEPFEMTFPLRGADQVYRPFLTRVKPIRDASGAIVRWHGVNTEIAALAAAEEALRVEKTRSEGVLEHMAECFALLDPEFRIIYMNSEGLRLDGRPAEDIVGRTHWEAYPDAVELGELYKKAAAENIPVSLDHRYEFPDGRATWIEMRAYPLPDHSIAVFYRDVTDRKFGEEALARERERFAILNETGAAIAAEMDRDKLVQLVTDAGVRLTGAEFGAFFYNTTDENGEALMLYALSGAPRSSFEKFPHPRHTAVFAPTFDGDAVVRSDDITKDPRYGKNDPYFGMPGGHLPVVSYLAIPVKSGTGEVLGGIMFGHKEKARFSEEHETLIEGIAGQAATAILNARLLEQAKQAADELEQRVKERTEELEIASETLRQSQKMEAIGQLTGGIAHDFNNLLTVIRGAADMLKSDQLSDEKRKRYISAIADTSDRAAKLTSQLLAFARRQRLNPETFDASERIQAVAEILKTLLGSRLRLSIEESCPGCHVHADPTQFDTALVNLAANARDAMDGDGVLTVSVRLRADAVKSFVEIAMTDTGHGIPTDKISRIFEPFFTTKGVGKGTGLGLSQVYGFAKQSEGEITVESQVGIGTTFRLLLPHIGSPPQVAPASAPAKAEMTNAPGGSVLLVEDNDDVRSFASGLLRDLGFRVTLAADGAEALSKLSDRSNAFDAVFSDVVMPNMSGLELAQAVRERWPLIPVVLASGYSNELVDRSRNDFTVLSKPYSGEQVLEALCEAMCQSREKE